MQQLSQGLRALSCRWQAAAERTSDPELKRRCTGHVVYLSMLADKLEPAAASAGAAPVGAQRRRDDGRAVVLVLEDDDICRDMARNVLCAAGFDVVCASSFNEAVDRVEDQAKIDVALIDVKMPAGSPHGVSFARMAQTRRPSMKVIFMSAHWSDDLRLIDEDEPFLCKPFTPHELLDLVARAAA